MISDIITQCHPNGSKLSQKLMSRLGRGAKEQKRRREEDGWLDGWMDALESRSRDEMERGNALGYMADTMPNFQEDRIRNSFLSRDKEMLREGKHVNDVVVRPRPESRRTN